MSSAFRLAVAESGLATLTFDLPDKKVNVFNRAAIEELGETIEELEGPSSDIRCLVLLSGKPRNFIAGADIDEIARVADGREVQEAVETVQALFSRWEALPYPTVAAVRGTCVGGGCELALASDYIVLSDREDVRIGLPEIKLGLVPAWGGCTRLPRKVGLTAALDVILAGKTLRPKKAHEIGLADALVPDASFEHEVRRFAERLLAGETPKDRKRGLEGLLLESNPLGRKVAFDKARKQVLRKTGGNYPAPLRAIEVIAAGLSRGKEAGFEAEARAEMELAISPVCKNLVHLFQLMEGAKGNGADGPGPRSTAVVGAGVMGGGIAQLIADESELPVRLKDIDGDALAQGMEHAGKLFGKQLRKGWIEKPEAARKLALLRPTLDYDGFERVDLVVEAVVEKLEVKRQVFAELERHVPDDAVLATNTSSLSIDLISAEMERPERCVGMHFFNPVHKMPLVEVISGSRTSESAARRVADFARALGKTPVVVRDGPGFLVNRLLGFTMAESLWLLDEGYAIEGLDRTVKSWGMPMGPLTLIDEVGIDVAVHVGQILADAFGDRLRFPDWFDRVVEDGRLGAKSERGFYEYSDGERQEPDEEVYELLGLEPTVRDPEPGPVLDRVLLPMVNEAARCLEGGLVASAGQLDLAMIMGTGFPPFRGGLCRWADAQTPAELQRAMEGLAERVDERFAPSEAFGRVVEAGGFYARWADDER